MKRHLIVTAASGLALAAGAACAQDSVTLRMADSFPTTHVISVEGAQFFMDRVAELSGGRISVEYFPASQLGKAGDMLTLVQSGAVDMAYTPPGYTAAKMPLSDVAHLPGLYSDVCKGAAAYTALATEGPIRAQDYDAQNIHLVFATPLAPYEISGPDVAITDLSDLRGKKIRATSAATNFVVEALGGVPVNINSGAEIYDALERGTIDFNLGPYSSYKAYDLYDQTSYGTTGFGFSNFIVAYSIGAAAYDRLPDDLKAAIDQAGAETSAHACAAVEAENTRALEEMRALGASFLEATPERMAAIEDTLEGVRQNWAADMTAKGFAGQETLDAMRAALGE